MSTFTKKVGCAALSCRKVFLLAAAAAMAFGAQADDAQADTWTKVYTFTFGLRNIPEHNVDGHPDLDLFYLVNASGQVLCYVDRGALPDDGWDGEMERIQGEWKLKEITAKHGAQEVGANICEALSGKSVLPHEVTAATIKKTSGGAANDRTISVTFSTNYDLDKNGNVTWYNEGTSLAGESKDLMIVVTNAELKDNDPNNIEYKYADVLGAARDFATDASGYTLTGGAAYPVPEPTSAMLLLLGFAGLALKRKQVA